MKSKSNIDLHLKALALKGWIDLVPGARGVRLKVNQDVPLLFVPNMPNSKLTRGLDPELDAVGGIASFVADRFKPRPDVFLELGPFGMPVMGLKEGETVALSTTTEPRDLDICVVRLNDVLLCRLFRQTGDGNVELIKLEEEGDATINRVDLGKHRLSVEGVVVGILRSLPMGNIQWYREAREELEAERRTVETRAEIAID